MVYYAKVEADKEAGGFWVHFPDVQGVFTQGETIEEALKYAHEALNGCLTVAVSEGLALKPAETGPGENLYPIEVEPHIVFADQLRKFRGNQSQNDIAKRIGIRYQSYQKLENAKKANPGIKTMQKAAKALGRRLEINMVEVDKK